MVEAEISDACPPRTHVDRIRIAGVTIGSTLIGGGGMRTVAAGTLLGIPGSHRHDRVHAAAPGGLAIRF